MIIKSSQLSMDASSGHMDVTKSVGGATAGRSSSGTANANDAGAFLFKDRLLATHFNNSAEIQSTVSEDGKLRAAFETEFVLNRTVEAMSATGVRVRSIRPDGLVGADGNALTEGGLRRYHRINRQQFSLDFMATRVRHETENMGFHSTGKVVTGDGRSIGFSLELSIQRTTLVRESYLGNLAAGRLVDPLVLSFDGGLDMLAEHSFLFDLDSDGQDESISGLNKGYGFLAFDRDGDGCISCGSELFGPRGGSGFGDLAAYDSDENFWIDENDPIFSQLQVWMGPAGGEQELLSLKEAGVGAISLSHAGSVFNLRSQTNTLLGQVSGSGIFLTEEGEVRPLQDVKLSVAEEGQAADFADERRGAVLQAIESLRAIIEDQRRRLDHLASRARIAGLSREEDDERWRSGLIQMPSLPERETLLEKMLISNLSDRRHSSQE